MLLTQRPQSNPSTIWQMVRFRTFLLWLMMLAVPFQGYAAAAMAFCAPEPVLFKVGMAHDHNQHAQASPQGAEHHSMTVSDHGDHHANASTQDDSSSASHKCSNCASCHAIGLTSTVEASIPHGLPEADIAEPFRPMATVSPGVPHKPPRA